MELSTEVQHALTSGHLAHLVTLNKDGSPQVSIVWVGLEDNEIVIGHTRLRQKLKNILRDTQVVLSLATGGKTNTLDDYLVIHGHARVTEGGAPELLNKLAQIYIGPGTVFMPDGASPGYITRITVERIHGVGPWN